MIPALFSPVLLPAGKAMLLGTASISFALALKRDEPIEEPFLRAAVAVLGLTFFSELATELFKLSDLMTVTLERLGNRDELKAIILDGLKRASGEPGTDGQATSLNIPALVSQVWRTGVWGVMAAITEFCFMLSSLLLEIGRDITWQLILLLYPLICGVYPVFPRLLHNFCFYTVCVAAWWPIFTLIAVVSSVIARHYMANTQSWGLAIVAVEVIAIIMTFTVPMITHRIVSGALSGSLAEVSVTKVLKTVTKVGR